MNDSIAIDTEGAGAAPILEFRDLCKSYGKVHALGGLNLTVRTGEVYGFLGRNGAGKSTAIRIAMGISKPTSGFVRLFGQKLSSNAVPLRRRIGYVAQEQNFYGWMTATSIGKFVSGFYPTWSARDYDHYIEALELPRDRKIQGFSGGMRAKLGLALALSHRPELLVLDEPTAGLDAVARREFIHMVREQARESGRTTFFSSHLIDEVESAADRVGIVDGGRTVFEGPLSLLAGCVRGFSAPIEAPVPPVFREPPLRLLQDHAFGSRRDVAVHCHAPSLLDALVLPEPWTPAPMSLEDIFVALVAKPIRKAADVADHKSAAV